MTKFAWKVLREVEGGVRDFFNWCVVSVNILLLRLNFAKVIPDDELKGLVEDLKIPLFKVGNYIPIWVPVDSVKVRSLSQRNWTSVYVFTHSD